VVADVNHARTTNHFEEDFMKSRNRRFLIISVSLLFFFSLFVYKLLEIVKIIRDPTTFTFTPLLTCVGLIVVMFFHGAAYVLFMDKKDKVKVIDDDEEWWTKWDRV